ncbi:MULTISPECIES: hypothetical protein [unclassified Isoptericola]|uniref:hypothetical protein n=1 Tax=unclassified Isoptericola TaxID=2623355 RepID=UPI002713911C|nr:MULTISPECIES: hypothetical protein [unclassified Isoptericola]MDO8144549.1 hypothetical protein [Isoptericola sp. 178]MDO8148393.1 hypothetical protein [Isoptericola sp. b515]MDO8151875.1 hypothetical protein [Isoptericola sp. b408]
MVTFVVWSLASLLLCAAVFLVASVMENGDDDGEGLRGFVRDFRAGLRNRGAAPPPPPVDTDMDAFFAANVEEAPGYVDADELSDALQRAQGRVRPHAPVIRPLGSVRPRAPRTGSSPPAGDR